MAYVLGFWFADGFMRQEKSYRILFFSKDYQIIRDIRSAFSSNHPIRKNTADNCYLISLCSKKLYKDLENLGGYRRKSKTVSFPSVPLKYMPDFIRGYFDGDGSVFYQSYKATKNGKIYTHLRSNFTSGSIKFISSLMNVLYDQIGLRRKVIGKFNDGASLKLGHGEKETTKLLKYMYYPKFSIGLQRKARFANLVK